MDTDRPLCNHVRAACFIALVVLWPLHCLGQDSPAARTAVEAQTLKPAELEALVAPIALHPDSLLSLVLQASSYPLEVIQARRWWDRNKSLNAEQLKAAADRQGWDQSVKSLVATPAVLMMMGERPDWTQKLGDAILNQEADVMYAIQRLRSKAYSNKKLVSTKELKVEWVQDGDIVVIESPNREMIYVPYYDPAIIYGEWPYSAYPPHYFPVPDDIAGGVIVTGIAFGRGYALRNWTYGANDWGGGCNWESNNLIVNRPSNKDRLGDRWHHKPEHRQGVRYNDSQLQLKFESKSDSAGVRQQFRGSDAQQVFKPGIDRINRRNLDSRSDLRRATKVIRSKGLRKAQRVRAHQRGLVVRKFSPRFSHRGRVMFDGSRGRLIARAGGGMRVHGSGGFRGGGGGRGRR